LLKNEVPSLKSGESEYSKRSAEHAGSKITKKVWIKASTEVVYKALTESKELERWFCDEADCDLHEGGTLVARWRTGKSVQKGCAIFRKLSPGSTVELLWVDDGSGTLPPNSNHTLTYEIRTKSRMTELIMTDRDDSTSDEETSSFLNQGWNSVLLELKDYCERKQRSSKLRNNAKKSGVGSQKPEVS
jgi:uncharacterized protein YndB with AHSA1/START domain